MIEPFKKLLTAILFLGMSNVVHGQTNTFPGSGNVGIGTMNPLSLLHIKNGDSGGIPHGFSKLTMEGSRSTMISILTPGSERGFFGFADESDPFVAGIQYDHDVDKMLFRVNNHSTSEPDLTIIASGNIGIGTLNPTAKLAVNGSIKAKEVIVTDQATDWPDYVFEEDYKLPDLTEVEAYIQKHEHLPGIPAKEEVVQEGQNLGAIQTKLLKKIEELTLIVIEQQKQHEHQQRQIDQLLKQNQALQQHLQGLFLNEGVGE